VALDCRARGHTRRLRPAPLRVAPMQTFKSILVEIDVTAASQPALDCAARIARVCGVPHYGLWA
jgi:hypothetical protein